MKHLQLIDLAGHRNALSIRRIFIELTGSHTTALFLEECWYWQHRANERGEAWFHMPLTTPAPGRPSWADYHLKRSHIDMARAALEPAGILKCHGSNFHEGYKTSWYELDLEALDEAVGRFKATGETLERTLTIAAWRVWRKEQSQRSLNDKPRSCRPMRAAAAVVKAPSRKAQAVADTPAESAPQPVATAVAVLDRPAPIEANGAIELPIEPADWKDMTQIERAKCTEWVRWNRPEYYWREAYALGFGDLMDTDGKPRSADGFTDAAIAQALKHLRSTSQGANAQKHNAESWLRRACSMLKSYSEIEFEDGLNRLTGIRKAVRSFQQKTAITSSSAAPPLAVDYTPSQPNFPQAAITVEQARAMSDADILRDRVAVPDDHPWRIWANIRRNFARSMGRPVREGGEPLDMGVPHIPFDRTPYV